MGAIQSLCHSSSPPQRTSVVVVTGCDSGVGRALATGVSEAGYTVLALCLTAAAAEQLHNPSQGIDSTGPGAVDVTSEDDMKRAFAYLEDVLLPSLGAGGQLWGLINNAAITDKTLVDWYGTDLTKMRRTMDVNYFGSVSATLHALPLLKASRGRVVFISSMGGYKSVPTQACYCSSKWAVEAFADALRMELRPFGIGITSFRCGGMNTPMVAALGDGYRASFLSAPANIKEEYGEEYMEKNLKFIQDGNEKSAKLLDTPDVVVKPALQALDAARQPGRTLLVGASAKILNFLVNCLGGQRSDGMYYSLFFAPKVEPKCMATGTFVPVQSTSKAKADEATVTIEMGQC